MAKSVALLARSKSVNTQCFRLKMSEVINLPLFLLFVACMELFICCRKAVEQEDNSYVVMTK